MNAPLTSLEQALARIASLEAALASKPGKLSLKVGQSGTVCLYHGARYPIALYASQWARIIPFLKSGEVEAFIEANRPLLAADKA
jgi:hypothetical protein